MTPPPHRSTLFPYTTLFRSLVGRLAGQPGVYVQDFPALADFVLDILVVFHVLENKRISRTKSARDRKSTRLNSSHVEISYAVFCLKKKKNKKKKSNQ